jgi:hypothetical protein
VLKEDAPTSMISSGLRSSFCHSPITSILRSSRRWWSVVLKVPLRRRIEARMPPPALRRRIACCQKTPCIHAIPHNLARRKAQPCLRPNHKCEKAPLWPKSKRAVHPASAMRSSGELLDVFLAVSAIRSASCPAQTDRRWHADC